LAAPESSNAGRSPIIPFGNIGHAGQRFDGENRSFK
jgi:hypothetical protein